jgi:hypothetical protein
MYLNPIVEPRRGDVNLIGKVDVGIGVAYKIADALNMPLSKLLKEAETHLKN